MGRRDVVMRSNPVRLIAFLGEAALHEMIGGPRVMADQLRHLIKVAESDTITIQVVRSYQGWHPGLNGPFVLYDFDGAPSIVLHEHHRTARSSSSRTTWLDTRLQWTRSASWR